MNMIITNLDPISPESLDKVLDTFGEVLISFNNNDIKFKVEKIADGATIYRGTLYVETSSLGYYNIGYIEQNFIDEIINVMLMMNKFDNRRD